MAHWQEEYAQERGEMASDERRQGGGFLLSSKQYMRERTLSICLSIHTRSSGGGVGGVQTPLPRHAVPTIAPLLPPLQSSDMQARLYLLRFHYPGCLFRHSNVSVAY